MDAKKIILKLDLHDDGDKQKVMKAVSKISGIDSITMNMKEMKLTVVGDIDPVIVVNKLRKNWNTSIFFVGPAKEPEKKKDEKKDDKKGDTKDDKKKDEGKKEGGGDKKKDSNDHMAPYNPYIMPYYNYPPHIVTHNPHMNYPSHIVTHNPHMYYPQHATTQYPPMATTPYYSHEENPNSCVIC